MEGKYTDGYLQREGANAPKVEPGDMKTIGSPLDFVGLNVYTPDYVRADASPAGYVVEKRPASYPHMASPWLYIGPEVTYWAVRNRQRHLEAEGALHHREWMLVRRCGHRRRTHRRHRSRHVSAQSSHPASPRRLRRLSDQRIFSVESDRQLSNGPTVTVSVSASITWISKPRSARRS